MFPAHRSHVVFTDSPLTLVQAQKHHRGPAIIEHARATTGTIHTRLVNVPTRLAHPA